MKTTINVTIHENSVTTRVRFYQNPLVYTEFSCIDETLPLMLLEPTNLETFYSFVSKTNSKDGQVTTFNERTLEGMQSTFYVDMVAEINAETTKPKWFVEDARHIYPHVGGRDVRDCFHTVYGDAILKNIFTHTAKRNVAELDKIFNALRKM